MRSWFVVALGATLSLSSSVCVWLVLQEKPGPWVEVVDGGLVRTTATEVQVNAAVETAMTERRESDRQRLTLTGSRFEQHADAWFTRPDVFGLATERARRLVREQRDAAGQQLRVVQLSGADMPSLVFVEHADTNSDVAERLAAILESRGCRRL
ncbi:MAG: hypothetical protein ACRCT8_16315 [Lacipirellulaceae bacterium]